MSITGDVLTSDESDQKADRSEDSEMGTCRRYMPCSRPAWHAPLLGSTHLSRAIHEKLFWTSDNDEVFEMAGLKPRLMNHCSSSKCILLPGCPSNDLRGFMPRSLAFRPAGFLDSHFCAAASATGFDMTRRMRWVFRRNIAMFLLETWALIS